MSRHVSVRPAMKHMCPGKKNQTQNVGQTSVKLVRRCLCDTWWAKWNNSKHESRSCVCCRRRDISAVVWCRPACRLLVWYGYIVLSKPSGQHIYQSTRPHMPKEPPEPRKHGTANCRKNYTMLVCMTHQTCTQGAYPNPPRPQMAQVVI